MNVPVKVVLKGTTSKTLNDRFTEMIRKRAPSSPAKNRRREETSKLVQASSKNRRLAEQMSHRSGTHAIMDQVVRQNDVKSRLGRTTVNSVKDRLGGGISVSQRNVDVRNRIGFKGQGSYNNIRSNNAEGNTRNSYYRGSRGSNGGRGGRSFRGRGRGGRGRGGWGQQRF